MEENMSIEELMEWVEKQNQERDLLIEFISKETKGNPIGVELGNGQRFVAILEEPDGTGRGRAIYFDEKGFSGHTVHPTPLDALKDAVKERYLQRADGTLDRLSQTREWEIGTLQADLVRQVNTGQITFEEYCAKVKAFRAQFEEEGVVA